MKEKIGLTNSRTEAKIKAVVTEQLGYLCKYLATERDYEPEIAAHYPEVCFAGSQFMNEAIRIFARKKLDYKIGKCVIKNSKNQIESECDPHAWLEYNDLIIDLTDFQFGYMDYELDPGQEIETLSAEQYNLSKINPETMQEDIVEQIFAHNVRKRYRENPNDKEKYFLEITDHLVRDNLDPELYADELRRCFKAITFYSKTDPNQKKIYEPRLNVKN